MFAFFLALYLSFSGTNVNVPETMSIPGQTDQTVQTQAARRPKNLRVCNCDPQQQPAQNGQRSERPAPMRFERSH